MWNPEGNLAKFVQFQKDVSDSYDTDLKENLKKWSFKEFEQSGYTRCKLTESKMCYVKVNKGILGVFKKPDILFSFNVKG